MVMEHLKTVHTNQMTIILQFSLQLADFNQDGNQDLVVANTDNDSVGILLGYGNGSFAQQLLYPMPEESSPVWIVIGDFNNDNISDLAVANRQGNNIGILIGIGDGNFKNVTTYSTGNRSAPSSIAIGDFDKDNCLDIAVINAGTKTVGTFFGYCNGTFSSQVTYAARADSTLTEIIVEDFNNDNILDIAITDFGNGNGNIAVLYGLGNRKFLIPKMYSTGFKTTVPWIAAKDLNNDGWMDFVVSISKKDMIGIMLHDNIEPLGMQTTFSTGTNSGPSAVAVNDIDKDGQLDLIVVNSKTNVVCILLGDGNGNFAEMDNISLLVSILFRILSSWEILMVINNMILLLPIRIQMKLVFSLAMTMEVLQLFKLFQRDKVRSHLLLVLRI